jgi:hypothetical protein
MHGRIRPVLVLAIAAALLIAAPSAMAAHKDGRAAPGRDPLQAITAKTVGAPTVTDPSGVPMPSGGVSGWTQVFSDNFSTNVPLGGFSDCALGGTLEDSNCAGLPSAVAAKWFAYADGWSDTSGNGIYEPSQVLSIRHHELDFYIHSNAAGEPLGSSVEPKIKGATRDGGLLYGAYMVRFKANLLPGYKIAWLLWPDAYSEGTATWPQDGEVDFPEGDMNGGFWAFMHWRGGTNGFDKYAYNTGDRFDKWQTALIEWTPQMVRFILNGKIIGTSTQHIPDTPMHWVLQTETATDGTIPAASTAGHVDVAWVSVYRTHESALRKLRRVER